MPLIFQPGRKYLLRQTYTVAVVGAAAISSLAYAGMLKAAKHWPEIDECAIQIFKRKYLMNILSILRAALTFATSIIRCSMQEYHIYL